MKKNLFLSVLITLACSFTLQAQTAKIISSKVFADSLQNQQKPILLDVRTPEEFSEGHLKSALNIEFKGAEFSTKIDGLDKTKTYYIYCRSGKRSAGAVNKMKELGFQAIYELEGGMLKWVEDGMQTVKDVVE